MADEQIPKHSDESSECESDQSSDDEVEEQNMTMESETKKRLIVVLDQATLETIRVMKKNELLDCNKHESYLRKNNRSPESARPDITHNSLLKLMDSPLNRHTLLQVYIETDKLKSENQVIEINPKTRLPRTYERFCGVFSQLIKGGRVKDKNSEEALLKIVKGNVREHLPEGTRIVRVDTSADKVVKVQDLVRDDDAPVAVFIKASVCDKKADNSFVDDVVSISNYPISVDFTCGMLCNAFARKWGIH